MEKSRKTTVKKSVLTLVVLALIVSLIGGTYARYVSTSQGNGNVDIAKWAVKVNNQDISNQSGTFDLTFTANNADTVEGKVAPGGTAVAYVDVDLTGTEVSVDFACSLAEESADNLKATFGENYSDKVTVSVGEPTLEGTTSNMTLDATTKVVTVSNTGAMSGKVRVPITLTWENDSVNNIEDTNTGTTKTNVTIPVTLTVQQHISE